MALFYTIYSKCFTILHITFTHILMVEAAMQGANLLMRSDTVLTKVPHNISTLFWGAVSCSRILGCAAWGCRDQNQQLFHYGCPSLPPEPIHPLKKGLFFPVRTSKFHLGHCMWLHGISLWLAICKNNFTKKHKKVSAVSTLYILVSFILAVQLVFDMPCKVTLYGAAKLGPSLSVTGSSWGAGSLLHSWENIRFQKVFISH